jgi:hypothetical protein
MLENIREKKKTAGKRVNPVIADTIDYRIIFMIKEKADKDKRGLDHRELESDDKIIKEVCKDIKDWGYFKRVTPTASGNPSDCAISSVRKRYFAKHR